MRLPARDVPVRRPGLVSVRVEGWAMSRGDTTDEHIEPVPDDLVGRTIVRVDAFEGGMFGFKVEFDDGTVLEGDVVTEWDLGHIEWHWRMVGDQVRVKTERRR
jgi:hypothetical protein